jgi:hypothetical protein
MKIASFNINNINTRLENLLAWLAQAKPDVACLQEPVDLGSFLYTMLFQEMRKECIQEMFGTTRFGAKSSLE